MDKWLYRISIVLVVIGLLVSIYMTIFKFTNIGGMCLGSGDCATVNASPYSEFYGIPVALFGVVGYATLLALHLLENKHPFLRTNATLILFTIALMGFLFTLYLIYAEILLGALCPFCLTSQTCMTIIFIISVIRLIRQPLN
jgi:uncharacterized membrane protein